jgi:hypothetical protein
MCIKMCKEFWVKLNYYIIIILVSYYILYILYIIL